MAASPQGTRRARSGRALLGVLGVLTALGCAHRPVSKPGAEVLAPSAASLSPDASPGDRAILRLGVPPTDKAARSALEFEVGLRHASHRTEETLDLFSNGEALEREVYESRADAFRVVSAGDDTFAPPLDLLRYPVREGGAWDWEGKVVYAGVSREARADVTVGRDGSDVRSAVTLFILPDEGRPERKRGFAFRFRKGLGVVARSFGDVSWRRPVGEPWRP